MSSERTFEFTDRALKGLPVPPKPKQMDYFDTKARGLGCRVSYGGKRSFFVLYGPASKRQRVSLGVALVHEPDLLLLDEPTVGLDPELRNMFWQHFKEMTDGGTTILISSHTMDDAAHCDTLGFMRGGKFIATGTPDELRQTTGKPNSTLEDAFLHLSQKSDASGESA
ncbi:MAG: hypothetical protein IIC53_04985 [Proteobacteria bacterium]|nr:hypothetical protein [Pseudomonadota bacterium]